jgi:hypothetical protein
MSEELPEAVRQALEDARTQGSRRRTRMKVRAGGQEFTILRHWDRGFALDPAEAPLLRGLVDLYDGNRHLCQALVVTSREEAGERVFEFKYANRVIEGPPVVDFVRDEGALPPA